ncbi:YbaK/EbsC family protein [Georgenia daeguensis]|uniref:YbaK/EbsC family protein n=2 Tax=Georgenia daeguensis TaxID=908355 RepID=A0ABP8EQW8_9MICO
MTTAQPEGAGREPAKPEPGTDLGSPPMDAEEPTAVLGELDDVVFGALVWVPARERPDLLAPPVHAAIAALPSDAAAQVLVAEIDPELADTAAMTQAYDLPAEVSSNCVLVAGRRAGEERVAACVVRATTRADVNTTVRKLLDVRKASFWPTERAVEASGMELGGITPFGLPPGWRLLLDTRVAHGQSIVGSGVRRSKLLVPGEVLTALPGAEVVEGLAQPAD